MCGIWVVFRSRSDLFTQCNAAFKIAHRGPDAFRLESIYQFQSCCLGFHRRDVTEANYDMQPIRVSHYPHICLIYDGNIYNHKNLQEQFDFQYASHWDGESIIHLYAKGGIEFAVKHLDGVFAFCLLDTASRKVYLGRDTFGVKPLFRILMDDGFLSVCSEVKGLMDIVGDNSKEKIQHVLPGHVETYSIDTNCQATLENIEQFHRIGDAPSYTTTVTPDKEIPANIRTLLENAVGKRMVAGRRIGCLLSGGLDSSLMTALVVKLAKERNVPSPIRTFSVGMEVSNDIAAARKVAKYLGTEHHEIIFTPEEATAAIENVIYCSESYDDDTVRESVGMYLLFKYLKEKTDTTVILSGEGADEIAQGYIYFHDALSFEDGDKESSRLCKDIGMFGLLRLDRISAAFGVEVRVPYLDHAFSSYYLSLEPEIKAPTNGIEKYLMRSAFDDTGLIPREIIWRRKEPFDVGLTLRTKSLGEMIEDFAGEKVKDSELENCVQQYPHNPPSSKESLYYRRIFEKFYSGQGHLIPYFWIPTWSTPADPST